MSLRKHWNQHPLHASTESAQTGDARLLRLERPRRALPYCRRGWQYKQLQPLQLTPRRPADICHAALLKSSAVHGAAIDVWAHRILQTLICFVLTAGAGLGQSPFAHIEAACVQAAAPVSTQTESVCEGPGILALNLLHEAPRLSAKVSVFIETESVYERPGMLALHFAT